MTAALVDRVFNRQIQQTLDWLDLQPVPPLLIALMELDQHKSNCLTNLLAIFCVQFLLVACCQVRGTPQQLFLLEHSICPCIHFIY
jgi:hypothetical protein